MNSTPVNRRLSGHIKRRTTWLTYSRLKLMRGRDAYARLPHSSWTSVGTVVRRTPC